MSEHDSPSLPTSLPQGERGEKPNPLPSRERVPEGQERGCARSEAPQENAGLNENCSGALADEIVPELLARLPTLKLAAPRRAVCLGADLENVPAALRRQYPEATWVKATAGADADLIWDAPAMGASFAPYTPARFRDIKSALANDGVFFFATLGPQTLLPLHALCSSATTAHAFATWPTLVDLGDALVTAGLTRPVLDRETLTFTYATAADALAELARDGWFDASSCAEDAARLLTAADGSVAVPFDVIYGVAYQKSGNEDQVSRISWHPR